MFCWQGVTIWLISGITAVVLKNGVYGVVVVVDVVVVVTAIETPVVFVFK